MDMNNTKKCIFILLVVYIATLIAYVKAELQRFDHQPTKLDGSLDILVIGDWGRRGLYNQSVVAFQMGKVGEELDADFIISTGDNFYDDGLIDEEDPLFVESFTEVYTSNSLQKQWYSVLGNHDYRGNVLAQLSPALRQRDSKWLCLRSFIVNSGNAEFFFVDTTPFQDKYFTEEKHEYDWRGVLPREEYLSNVLKEVDMALEESSAKWKIVIGHHTIFSASHHGNTQELVDQLLPILEANEVDLYINGHDHCLQHISSQNSVVAELQRFDHQPTKADGSLDILVIGDWGRRGLYNQSNVAFQMGKVGEKLNADFIISTGDNFYEDGLLDEEDDLFVESFTQVYTAISLQKQWYSVLGNHDYRGNALAQLSPVLIQKDSKWLCLRSFIVNSGIVEFFFFDTTPFQDKYFTEEEHNYDWRGVLPRGEYLSNALKELDTALGESSAKWKIVIGHHTIFSAGHHGNTQELVDQLLPILEAKEVDLYINGHDHCLQHISSQSRLQFLTSGGGSKAWTGEITPWDPNEMKFYYDGQGFMTLQVTENEISVAFYDVFGEIIHKWSTSKYDHMDS